MGGDHAPEEIVAGALLAAQEFDVEVVLVGDEARVRSLLPCPVVDRITLVHAPESIAMDLTPSTAARSCERTSLGVAVHLVKQGEADAVVSAGNSGAFVAIAFIKLRMIEGVSRPAIATVWPAINGPTILLDSGATVDCRPEWLEQFGVMGSAYAKAVLGIAEPRVAVLSNGEERSKGNQLVLEAARLLEAAPVRFIGNVEGRDLFNGRTDVAVCDGFGVACTAPCCAETAGPKPTTAIKRSDLRSLAQFLIYAPSSNAPQSNTADKMTVLTRTALKSFHRAPILTSAFIPRATRIPAADFAATGSRRKLRSGQSSRRSPVETKLHPRQTAFLKRRYSHRRVSSRAFL